jgi:hypothetical protein
MLRISMTDAGQAAKAFNDGLVQKLIQQTTETVKPEAAYFTADHGVRTAYFFFDMKDSSQMPAIGEPWFQATHAKVEFMPVMNGDDLKAGLEKRKQ